ncbi:helix-turn-helix domain-containing protein [Pseudomonas paralcaligenes]|uniref:helix-turn-helix domain-containing protein n=1 Tax=Pseudomonas paralcaligenes TaxID=2772558 RepID=UPI001C809328|nr:helix-turn-helix domain-containing protein [Pseudomonas paralcaligenes]
MSQKDDSLDLCSVKTFAELSGVSVEQVINWVDSQTIPSMKLADFRMVNLARLRADLEKGKTVFKEGDYAHV